MSPERIIAFSCVVISVHSHIIADKSQLTALKTLCEHAYSCFHDKVIVCGKSVNEARTFIDLCDMYEYSCEYVMVFRHVKDDEYCPNQKELGVEVG
ncbi:hypothetical protein MSG28_011932 [Choristoneura fumiferana]|uniref:Uncharacterized protein n=1 Tax=Choristoneura fumiferana TaxID=7141 RepID=A0ACC0KMW1_CHOFU|nr:hypothetical protein MSG28_011932 [Choristoneura fumiferana]